MAKERDRLSVAQHAYNIGQLAPLGRKPIDAWPPEVLFFYARHSYDTDAAWYGTMGGTSFEWTDEVCDAIPGKVSCPVHVAYGDAHAGSLVSTEDLNALSSAGVNLTATHFPGAGHGISFPFARAFIDDLKAFLGRLPA
jgi:hypothetical protein